MKIRCFLPLFFGLCCASALTIGSAAELQLTADVDAASKAQSIDIGQADFRFDPDLNFSANSSCTWRAAMTDTPSGYNFFVSRSPLSGSQSLLSGLRLFVEDAAGQVAFVPSSKYQTGVPLAEIPETPDNIGFAKGSGIARFKLILSAEGKTRHGSGHLSGLLSITGTLNSGL